MAGSAINVIVPVYNNEAFICSIIDTLENQTMPDFKAIFVDDGSTDNSLTLLQECLKNSSLNSTVIHQENKGLSAARNAGIKASEAEWIAFMDCDDKADPHFLTYLYRGVMENNTLLGYCGFQKVHITHQNRIRSTKEYHCSVISAAECMENYYNNWVGAWCWIVNRNWLLNNNLLFDEECTYCEDVIFITKIIEATDKIAKINNELYIYIQRQGSLIHSAQIDKFRIGLNSFMRMDEEISGKNSSAATVFRKVGKTRYILATLRKSAVQLSYLNFMSLTEQIDSRSFKMQIKYLPLSKRIAGYLYLCSRTMFYYIIHIIFNE